MSDSTRRRYDAHRPKASLESQLRMLLVLIAVVLFVIARWIFLTYGDASRGSMWLRLGLASVAGCVMIPPTPAK